MTVDQSDMQDYLLCAIGCLCFLTAGLGAEECSPTIIGKRGKVNVPEGGSVSLSCVVQHCGHTWTGSWIWSRLKNETSITNSQRHRVTIEELSSDQTRLVLTFQSVNRSDEGAYGCEATWDQDDSAVGHQTYLNITAAVPSQRNLLHRFLVCGSAALCLPVILGLVWCLRSRVRPQPLPVRPSTHMAVYRDRPQAPPKPGPRPHCAAPGSQHNTEVLYADISQEALRSHGGAREPALHSTVYSTVKYS